jgi:uncharacterized membrane protein YoaK (UPF0700 family)
MNETRAEGAALSISIGLAFVGGYADAASFLLARTFTGHLTGNCVLAAVSAAENDWPLTLDRLFAVILFVTGILFSMILYRFLPTQLRPSSLAIAMAAEVFLCLSALVVLTSGSLDERWFIACMCLALGIQNGALGKTKGISVHSTYMTGMVTTLAQKSFDHLTSGRSPQDDLAKASTRLTIRVLVWMWVSFTFGAVAGALLVSWLHRPGLLGMALALLLLTFAEMKNGLSMPGTRGA